MEFSIGIAIVDTGAKIIIHFQWLSTESLSLTLQHAKVEVALN